MSSQILVFHLLYSLFFLLRALIKVCVAVKTEAYLELVPKHQRNESFRESMTIYFFITLKRHKAKSAKGKSVISNKVRGILFYWSHTGH